MSGVGGYVWSGWGTDPSPWIHGTWKTTDTVDKRAVRILLECFLVYVYRHLTRIVHSFRPKATYLYDGKKSSLWSSKHVDETRFVATS